MLVIRARTNRASPPGIARPGREPVTGKTIDYLQFDNEGMMCKFENRVRLQRHYRFLQTIPID
jgi:hypothetical protein